MRSQHGASGVYVSLTTLMRVAPHSAAIAAGDDADDAAAGSSGSAAAASSGDNMLATSGDDKPATHFCDATSDCDDGYVCASGSCALASDDDGGESASAGTVRRLLFRGLLFRGDATQS